MSKSLVVNHCHVSGLPGSKLNRTGETLTAQDYYSASSRGPTQDEANYSELTGRTPSAEAFNSGSYWGYCDFHHCDV